MGRKRVKRFPRNNSIGEPSIQVDGGKEEKLDPFTTTRSWVPQAQYARETCRKRVSFSIALPGGRKRGGYLTGTWGTKATMECGRGV